MALPSSWVDRIHTRLLVRYGTAWMRMWAGIDEVAVKADWAEVLGHMSEDHIRHALEHLPLDKPPTASQFVALGRGVPVVYVPALPAPPADPDVVAKALNAITRPKDHDPKAWAYRLRDREANGDRLTLAQRDMWRAALGAERDEATT